MEELNDRPGVLKQLLEEKVGNTFEDVDTGEDFLPRTVGAHETQPITNKWDLVRAAAPEL